MTIGTPANRGSAVSGTSGTTLALAVNAAIAAGTEVFVLVAWREAATVTGVTDAVGNVYTRIAGHIHSAGNARQDVWHSKLTTGLASAQNITATWSVAILDRAVGAIDVTVAAGNSLRQAAAAFNNEVTGVAGFGSASFSALPSRQYLWLRSMVKQANATTAITATSGYVSAGWANRSRNNASAIMPRAEWRVATETGSTSNPTLATTGNTSASFLALVEFTIHAGAANGLAAANGSAAATVIAGVVVQNAAANGIGAATGESAASVHMGAAATGAGAASGTAGGFALCFAAASGVGAAGGSAAGVVLRLAAASGTGAASGSAQGQPVLVAAAGGAASALGEASATVVVGVVVVVAQAGGVAEAAGGAAGRLLLLLAASGAAVGSGSAASLSVRSATASASGAATGGASAFSIRWASAGDSGVVDAQALAVALLLAHAGALVQPGERRKDSSWAWRSTLQRSGWPRQEGRRRLEPSRPRTRGHRSQPLSFMTRWFGLRW